jgi:hypothetical protein
MYSSICTRVLTKTDRWMVQCYNAVILRNGTSQEGHRFRGHSDFISWKPTPRLCSTNNKRRLRSRSCYFESSRVSNLSVVKLCHTAFLM